MVTLVQVKPGLELDLDELEFSFIRAQGSGGQHVNKVSTAVQLRFDIERSSLPDEFKQKLLQYPDDRISKSGVIVIKAQAHRSQDMNKEDAVAKLMQLLQSASFEAKKRRATKPTFGARMDRLKEKTQHKERKKMRGKVGSFD